MQKMLLVSKEDIKMKINVVIEVNFLKNKTITHSRKITDVKQRGPWFALEWGISDQWQLIKVFWWLL